MKSKQIVFTSIFLQLVFSCASKMPLNKPTLAIEVSSELPKSNFVYSQDSSFIFIIDDENKMQFSEPISFIIISNLNFDTVYVSKKEFNFVKWSNDSILLLRKYKGVLNTAEKSKLNQFNRPENYVEQYLNCKTLKKTKADYNINIIKP
jgi:hypothetical protein